MLIDELVDEGDDVEALKESTEFAGRSDQIAEHDQKTWFNKTTFDLTQDSIQYKLLDDDAAAEFDKQHAYFESEDYQRNDLEAFCNLLQIP